MARKPDVQYIRCYTDGSSARALRQQTASPKTKLPKRRKKTAWVIRLDPLAYAGILVSVMMLVLMVVSCVQLVGIQQQANLMDDYVDALKEENARLADTYEKGYDLEDIRVKAEAMGLVPIDQVEHITVSVPHAAQEDQHAEVSAWAFLTDIFP